jgi:uncharacterized protein RhaS with RHS repeats
MTDYIFRRIRRLLLTCAATSLVNCAALAQSCDQLSNNLDDARLTFGQLRGDVDIDAAQTLARQVRGELGNAAVAALSCRCQRTYIQLSTATAHARQAEEAATMTEYMDQFNRAILSYNDAVADLRNCR